jgi:site-specific DNA-methyltransferase (adenine-specific)
MTVTIHHGDMLEVLPTLPADSVDSCVTDPPYHLTSIVKRFGGKNAAPAKHGTDGAFKRASAGFMGKQWDGGDVAFRPETWAEVWRVLKPGAHLLAFAAPRNVGRMQVAIEDAGFALGSVPAEVRDAILYMMAVDTRWNLFLASLTDEQRGAFVAAMTESDPSLLAWVFGTGFPKSHDFGAAFDKALFGPYWDEDGGEPMPMSTFHAHWEGWGSALKPAFEPIILARKPLSQETVSANVLKHGTGAINIDACRVATEGARPGRSNAESRSGLTGTGGALTYGAYAVRGSVAVADTTQGRWPANVITDGSEEVLTAFPSAPGQQRSVGPANGNRPSVNCYGDYGPRQQTYPRRDSGLSARFFYSAKADKEDRLQSKHPTVKPVDLMAYLCRLVTPPGGTVLDPFAGSGTTGMACLREGFDAILIEKEAEYVDDIKRRLDHVKGADGPLFAGLGAA